MKWHKAMILTLFVAVIFLIPLASWVGGKIMYIGQNDFGMTKFDFMSAAAQYIFYILVALGAGAVLLVFRDDDEDYSYEGGDYIEPL